MHRESSHGTSESPDAPTPARDQLRVVIAFGDLPAYKHALRLLVRIVHQLGEDIDLRPLPWPFESLEDPTTRELAAADAQRSSLVVVAATKTVSLPPSVQQWVKTCCQHRDHDEPLLIGLLGGADEPSDTVAQNLELLQHAAAEGGWHFLSPHATRREAVAESSSRSSDENALHPLHPGS